MKHAIIGLDLGGSNLFTVAFEETSKDILLEEKVDTNAKKGVDYVINLVSTQIESFITKLEEIGYKVTAIGLAIPGILSLKKGFVMQAPNLNWKNLSLLEKLEISKSLKKKIVLINDVNAGLYGELSEFLTKPKIVVAYFCGTGIGGAIALNGKILLGHNGYAGEVGHMVVRINGKKCLCGRKGCLEAYIGKWALNKKIQKAIKTKKTLLKKIIDYDLKKIPIKSASLKKAYKNEDPFVKNLLEKYYSYYLAGGISQAVNFLNPEVIILGGGIMEALGDSLLPFIKKYLERFSIQPPELVLSKKGDYAGTLGAALYAHDKLKLRKIKSKS